MLERMNEPTFLGGNPRSRKWLIAGRNLEHCGRIEETD
jgi:hypothetical protein